VIVVREKTHKVFQRVREHLLMSKRLTLSEALCGFQFTTDFLDGKPLTVRSEPGQIVRPTDMMVIKGKGMPRSNGQPAGDLLVVMDVDFPESIPSEKQDELLQILGGSPLPTEIPERTEAPVKLTQRQKEDLKRQIRRGSQEEQHRGGRGGQQASCAQQ
jgi:DnaJ family protein A protein 2